MFLRIIRKAGGPVLAQTFGLPYIIIDETRTKDLGQGQEDVKAPFTGILLYVIGTPPCNAGEPLFEVGRVREK
jgi:hypothetical protein